MKYFFCYQKFWIFQW